MEKLDPKKPFPAGDTQGRKSAVAFLFPGQGAQQVGMGRELYEYEPVFRREVDHCCGLLAPELGLDLRGVLYPADSAAPEAGARLTETSLTQPALFVVEYALAQVWLARGVRPQAMIGHSLGEYVAAVLAGIFTLKDALHLLAVRGRLMQALPPGAMLAVALPEADLASRLDPNLFLAAVNGPRSCVVSGPTEAVSALGRRLGGENVACRELKTSHAFHSAMMDPILAEFENEVRRVPRAAPQIPIISSLHGRAAPDAEWTDPAYWSGQLRRTVRFAEALGALLATDNLVLLEVGPGQTLTALARQQAVYGTQPVIVSSSARTAGESDRAALLEATGRLWVAGVEIQWAALHSGKTPRKIALPTYPFERQRHWIEPTPMRPALAVIPEKENTSTSASAVISSSDLEALLGEQLRVMRRQIEVLRHVPLASGADRKAGS